MVHPFKSNLKKGLGLVIIALVAFSAVSFYQRTHRLSLDDVSDLTASVGNGMIEEGEKSDTYTDNDLSFSFSYRTRPNGYSLHEDASGDNFAKSFYVMPNDLEDSEYIKISVGYNPKNLSLLRWVKENINTDFVKEGSYTFSKHFGKDAIVFEDTYGELIGTHKVVSYNGRVYVFSVFHKKNSSIEKDFEEIINKVEFKK